MERYASVQTHIFRLANASGGSTALSEDGDPSSMGRAVPTPWQVDRLAAEGGPLTCALAKGSTSIQEAGVVATQYDLVREVEFFEVKRMHQCFVPPVSLFVEQLERITIGIV